MPNISTKIIFITTYNNYTIQTFQITTFNYLLKPIQINKLNQILNQFKKTKSPIQLPQHTKILIKNFNQHNIKKLIIQNINNFKIIPLKNIFYLQNKINYTHLFLQKNKKIITNQTLKNYKTFLINFKFFHIHQSYLINLNHIKKYIKKNNNKIIINNKQHLNLSHKKKQQFLNHFLNK